LTRPDGLVNSERAGVQARRCLDEGTDEAWQIDNETQPADPKWRRNAAQTLSFARQILTVRLWLL
jgi:hypothetical protein